MKYFNLLSYDLKKDREAQLLRLILLLLISLAFFSFFYLDVLHIFWRYPAISENIANLRKEGVSLADGSLYLTGGILPFSSLEDMAASPYPTKWLAIQLMILYFTSEYTRADIGAGGIQVLSRMHRRCYWWLSKCLWNLLTVLACFTVLFLSWICLLAVAGFSFDLSIHPACFQSFFGSMPEVNGLSIRQACMIFLALPVCTCLASSLLQMTLTLYIRPVYAYLLTCIYYILGMFLIHPIFLVNYAMSVRSSAMGFYRFRPEIGLLLCLASIFLAVGHGLHKMSRIDMIDKREAGNNRSWL